MDREAPPDRAGHDREAAVLAPERRALIVDLTQTRGTVRVEELIEALGVSGATVRRDLEALAEDGLVEKFHGGVSAVAPPVPAQTAAAARPGPQRQIGVVIPGVSAYYQRLIDGVRGAAADPGAPFGVTLAIPEGGAASERILAEGLVTKGADGLLVLPALGPHPEEADEEARAYADWLRALPVPTVLIERELTGPQLGPPSSIRTSHDRGAAAAVHYLHGLGHRRIALVARDDTQTSTAVRAGWEAAVETLRITPRPPLILGKDSPDWEGWRAKDLDAMLAAFDKDGVTAVLCHNDEDALALSQHAQAQGRGIPGDLSLISYDDELAGLASPPLTAVSPPRVQLGAMAAKLLLSLIDAWPDAPSQRVHVEPSLIVRDSTAPPH